jgi:hypothetical protein
LLLLADILFTAPLLFKRDYFGMIIVRAIHSKRCTLVYTHASLRALESAGESRDAGEHGGKLHVSIAGVLLPVEGALVAAGKRFYGNVLR